MSPFSSVHTFKNLRVFTVICGKEILRPFSKCDVRCWEHMSSFGKVHSASSSPPPPLFFVQWHAGTRIHVGNPCVMDLLYQFHVICGQEFKAFLCLRWSVQSIFYFPPRLWLCACALRCECDFYFSCSLTLISLLLLLLLHPFIVSILFFNL